MTRGMFCARRVASRRCSLARSERVFISRTLLACAITFVLGTPALFASPITVQYQTSDLGGGHWSYAHQVTNDSFASPVREFTIYFDQTCCRNLQVITPNPPAADWNEMVFQPDVILKDDGFYDALSLGAGILQGSSTLGFAVQFDWLGTGEPASQAFEIVDPVTFQTVYRGITIPEPCTAVMMVLAMCLSIGRFSRPVSV